MALLDTSALTCDVLAALRRQRSSALVKGMQAGTIRSFIPHHVWAEVPRVLEDRYREGGKFDLAAAEALWWTTYVQLLRVVPTEGLPLTEEALVLAHRDPSDVGTLTLAGVLAPVVVFSTDPDLLSSGWADPQWGSVRAAVGKVRDGEVMLDGGGALLGLTLEAGTHAVRRAAGFTRAAPAVSLIAFALAAGGVALWHWRRPGDIRAAASAARQFVGHVSQGAVVIGERHRQGREYWSSAERGLRGDSSLHRVARHLALALSPLTRTQILRGLTAEMGDEGAGSWHSKMAGLDWLLHRYPLFHEVERGRWQVGRSGADFGGVVEALKAS